MARRPIFLPHAEGPRLVTELYVDFQWFPGMSLKQKQRSVQAFHTMARETLDVSNPLEISSKSPDELGVRLSSFNLQFITRDGRTLSVETAFQGSKVFAHGGPFRELFWKLPKEAKRDPRLQDSGPLQSFSFFGAHWPLTPRTAFYDWVYINALLKNPALARKILDFDAFTDIEFNPDRSVNCQARSAALYCALERSDQLAGALQSPKHFRSVHERYVPEPRHVNYHNPLV